MDYTIVGGPVNVASRLESTADADQIQISHETYMLVKDEIYCRPIGDVKVKGVARELRMYEVVGPIGMLSGRAAPIHQVGSGFTLTLDPGSLAAEDAERARETLRRALAALDDD